MTDPIYAGIEHKAIIEAYITMNKQFAEDVSTKSKYKNYLEVVKMIIDYHNNYGVETKTNAAKINSYRNILTEMVFDVVEKLEAIEQVYE